MKKVFFLLLLPLILTSTYYSLSFANNEYFTKVEVSGGEIQKIEICPSSPTVVYAGSQKAGLWVSKDGGQTWQETNFFKTAGTGTNVFAVHQNEPNIIIAAGVKPESQSTYINSRLYRSEDYGQTWQSLENLSISNFTKIVNSKKFPDEFYLLGHSGPDYPFIYKSTDKGKTWTELSQESIHSRFDYNPALDMVVDNNNNIFVISDDNTPPIGKQIGFWLGNRYLQLGEARIGYLFVSTDNVNTFSYSALSSYYDYASTHTYATSYENPAPWMISSGSNTIVFAAVSYSTFTADKYYGIYAATSTQESIWQEYNKKYYAIYGDTWTARGIYFARVSTSVCVDIGFAMAVSPDGQKIYCYDPQKKKILVSTFSATAGFGEFFEWSTGFLDGNTPIQANDFVIDPQNPNKMFIADQSRYGILISSDGGKNWTPTNTGVTALITYDGYKGPDKVIYILTKMAVYKSADGNNWSEVFSTITPQGEALELDEGAIISPKEGVVIVAADGYVYRSEDGGSSWSLVLISTLSVTKPIVFSNDGSGVGYIAFREPNPGIIPGYTTSRKYIYKTTDWGKTWTPLNLETMSVQSLALNPKQQNVLYAGLGEISFWEGRTYTFGGLLKITDNYDGSVSTEIISARDFPSTIIINPDNPEVMYGAIIYDNGDPMGTTITKGSFGISFNGGKGWQETRGGAPIEYPISPGEQSPNWRGSIYDIKYSSGILYWINSDGVFALIDNNFEVKWLANSSELGTAQCLILGSLYMGTSTGLYKLTTLPTQLSIQIADPRCYAYPNPCDLSKGQRVVLKYLVPQGKNVDWLEVSIYNIAGELVRELPRDDTNLNGGFGYYYEWDGKNQSGKTCARGVYIAVFKSNLGVSRTKIILVK